MGDWRIGGDHRRQKQGRMITVVLVPTQACWMWLGHPIRPRLTFLFLYFFQCSMRWTFQVATSTAMSMQHILDQKARSRCFGNIDRKIVYVVGFLKIHDRWEGSKKIGGILSRGKNRTNINPKDYSKRLLTYMVNSVPKHR